MTGLINMQKLSTKLKILVACEESQEVTKRLRGKGFLAYSNDIIECSGGRPEWHIQEDLLDIIDEGWDAIIAFPPCTDLAVSGARHFERKRKDGSQQRSIDFFMLIANAVCPFIAIENPIGIMSTKWRKPDQIIQPWQFGHGETKATCLWLRGFKPLIPTDIVEGREQKIWKMPPSKDRAKLRSKTYPGIAQAMADQWGAQLGSFEKRLNERNIL
jgi:site-specific DNA-cytosine methylase